MRQTRVGIQAAYRRQRARLGFVRREPLGLVPQQWMIRLEKPAMTDTLKQNVPSPYQTMSLTTPVFAANRLDELRINRASLAAESRIIKRLMQQRSGAHRHELNAHRTGRIRSMARSAHLAWGFILGREYAQLEAATTRKRIPRKEVAKKISSMGYNPELLDQWFPDEVTETLRIQINSGWTAEGLLS